VHVPTSVLAIQILGIVIVLGALVGALAILYMAYYYIARRILWDLGVGPVGADVALVAPGRAMATNRSESTSPARLSLGTAYSNPRGVLAP
jgi:hypothetical protein